jgi:hypothetical protein
MSRKRLMSEAQTPSPLRKVGGLRSRCGVVDLLDRIEPWAIICGDQQGAHPAH